MHICGNVSLYQGKGGISLGYLLVRTGAWKSVWPFLPAIPPRTVSGKVTRDQISPMITMVPNGSAAVER